MSSSFKRSSGNALPETALVVSLVLLLAFGAVQTAIVGFTQVAADGAAFVSAHSAIEHYTSPNATQSAVQTFVSTVANSVFSRVKTSEVSVSNPPICGTFETTVTKTMPGFRLPGAPSQITLTSRDIEEMPPASAGCAGGSLLNTQSLPHLPNAQNCPSILGLSTAFGSNTSGLATQVANQLATGQGMLSQESTLLTDINGVLGQLSNGAGTTGLLQGNTLTTDITNAITPALSSITGLLGLVLAPLLNIVSATLNSTAGVGAITNAVENTIGSLLSAALNGTAPSASTAITTLTTNLSSSLSSVLGPILGGLTGQLLTPIASALATQLEQTVLAPLFPALTKLAGDHSTVSTLLNGSC